MRFRWKILRSPMLNETPAYHNAGEIIILYSLVTLSASNIILVMMIRR